ncbi:neutral zinc metallopeptidase [Kribbella sp. NPDC050124]|uniref:neutral zinc metallopeptidase n=1 Tax=Kribbella sp. NPDC050124 TaxID=3364114 RepID=UPI003789E6D0
MRDSGYDVAPGNVTMVGRTASGWLTIALIAATLACGCDTSGDSATTTSPGAQPTPGSGTVEAVDRETMKVDEERAVRAVDTYWRRQFTERFGQPYQSPRVVGSYVGNNGPPCGGEPAVPFNAVYCHPGDYVAWDDELMNAGYSQIGDAWIYLIIAHEWGHAIQARLGSDQVAVDAELQADCLAGAALQGAAEDGLIGIEPGDTEEIARTLAAVADDYPWTDVGDHGNAEQRTEAFNTGVSGGVDACIS